MNTSPRSLDAMKNRRTEGIYLCERVFGTTITTSTGRVIPVRWIGEQHATEDLGQIPAATDWLRHMQPAPWMTRGARRLSAELEAAQEVG